MTEDKTKTKMNRKTKEGEHTKAGFCHFNAVMKVVPLKG